MEDIWQALYDAHADVVLNGHEHDYERFARQTPNGTHDTVNGIREFVVGTGGRSHNPSFTPRPNSEVRIPKLYGVLRLNLRPDSYDWQFITVGGVVMDQGTEPCR